MPIGIMFALPVCPAFMLERHLKRLSRLRPAESWGWRWFSSCSGFDNGIKYRERLRDYPQTSGRDIGSVLVTQCSGSLSLIFKG